MNEADKLLVKFYEISLNETRTFYKPTEEEEPKALTMLDYLTNESYLNYKPLTGGGKLIEANIKLTYEGIEKAKSLKSSSIKKFVIACINFFKRNWKFIISTIVLGGISCLIAILNFLKGT